MGERGIPPALEIILGGPRGAINVANRAAQSRRNAATINALNQFAQTLGIKGFEIPAGTDPSVAASALSTAVKLQGQQAKEKRAQEQQKGRAALGEEASAFGRVGRQLKAGLEEGQELSPNLRLNRERAQAELRGRATAADLTGPQIEQFERSLAGLPQIGPETKTVEGRLFEVTGEPGAAEAKPLTEAPPPKETALERQAKEILKERGLKNNAINRATIMGALKTPLVQIDRTPESLIREATNVATAINLVRGIENQLSPKFFGLPNAVKNSTLGFLVANAPERLAKKFNVDTQAIANYAQFWSRTESLFGELRNQRFGGALTENEAALAERFIPTRSDSVQAAQGKIKGLLDFLAAKGVSIENLIDRFTQRRGGRDLEKTLQSLEGGSPTEPTRPTGTVNRPQATETPQPLSSLTTPAPPTKVQEFDLSGKTNEELVKMRRALIRKDLQGAPQ